MSEKDKIKTRLEELKILINETKKRLPAHSTKPTIMQELIDLENEYDMLHQKISTQTIDRSVN